MEEIGIICGTENEIRDLYHDATGDRLPEVPEGEYAVRRFRALVGGIETEGTWPAALLRWKDANGVKTVAITAPRDEVLDAYLEEGPDFCRLAGFAAA